MKVSGLHFGNVWIAALVIASTGCAAPSNEPFADDPVDKSVDDSGEAADGTRSPLVELDPYRIETWRYHTRSGACGASRIGQAIHQAALGAKHDVDMLPVGRADHRWLTYRNMAGPALLDGAEMFPALRSLIANARYEVDLQWHIIEADSDAFEEVIEGLRVLNERLRANPNADPVRVRILYGHGWLLPGQMGVFSSPTAIGAEPLADAIHARIPNVHPKLRILLASHIWRILDANVMHVKLAVIDGVHVHIGGGNLSNAQNFKRYRGDLSVRAPDSLIRSLDATRRSLLSSSLPFTEQLVRATPLRWPEHDSAYVLKGEIAQAVLAQFDQIWTLDATDVSDCSKYFRGEQRSAECNGVEPGVFDLANHAPQVAEPDYAQYGIPDDACLPMIFLPKDTSTTIGNQDHRNVGTMGIYAAFDAARDVLRVSSPNVNLRGALKVMDAAKRFRDAKRGTARVIEPWDFNWYVELVPVIGGGTNPLWGYVLTGAIGKESVGVDRPLDLRWQSLNRRDPYLGWGEEHGRHIKYYSVDSQVAIVGSYNLDEQSALRSREVCIAIDDPTVTRAYDAKIFDPDFARGAPLASQ